MSRECRQRVADTLFSLRLLHTGAETLVLYSKVLETLVCRRRHPARLRGSRRHGLEFCLHPISFLILQLCQPFPEP